MNPDCHFGDHRYGDGPTCLDCGHFNAGLLAWLRIEKAQREGRHHGDHFHNSAETALRCKRPSHDAGSYRDNGGCFVHDASDGCFEKLAEALGGKFGPLTKKPNETYEAWAIRMAQRDGAEKVLAPLLAQPVPAPALDAERLGRAWGNVMDGRRIGEGLHAARIGRDTTTADDWQAIAREYAALASEPSDD